MRHGWASTRVPAAGVLAAVLVLRSCPGCLQDRNGVLAALPIELVVTLLSAETLTSVRRAWRIFSFGGFPEELWWHQGPLSSSSGWLCGRPRALTPQTDTHTASVTARPLAPGCRSGGWSWEEVDVEGGCAVWGPCGGRPVVPLDPCCLSGLGQFVAGPQESQSQAAAAQAALCGQCQQHRLLALRALDSAGRLWKRPTLGWYLTSPCRRTELRICGRLRARGLEKARLQLQEEVRQLSSQLLEERKKREMHEALARRLQKRVLLLTKAPTFARVFAKCGAPRTTSDLCPHFSIS
ncbi:hypothetical protein J1605_019544 [Eschrichtius robustus]|uniref:Uncharacterized protein n=1 Tax=Eschrichtius robustus TaxID=9764 RepID=A0AB34HQA3_ESCRO|nr:hypothetical protein J1605_019544 [Eschrichtius robustus]